MNKWPEYYDYENRECKICGVLLQPDLKFVQDHEQEAFHIKKMLEKHFSAKEVKMEKDKQVAIKEEQSFDLIQRPKEIIEDARLAATQLTDILKSKKKKVVIGGEQYLEFEDWQTLGRFYGLFVKTGEPELVNIDGVKGFKAEAKVVLKTGVEVGSATAYCLRDEKNWGDKPIFQLSSMAQTRAGAKALRNLLAWVAVLAGYRPTPAEEIVETHGEVVKHESAEETATDGKKTVTYTEKTLISDPQRKRLFAIGKASGMPADMFTNWLMEKYGIDDTRKIQKDWYEDICNYVQNYKQ